MSKENLILPFYEEIPQEFKSCYNEWNVIASQWFMKGIFPSTLKVKDTYNSVEVFCFLNEIQQNYSIGHEHKMAAIAYLMSILMENTKK